MTTLRERDGTTPRVRHPYLPAFLVAAWGLLCLASGLTIGYFLTVGLP